MGCPEFLRKAGECEDQKGKGQSSFEKLWQDARKGFDKAVEGSERKLEESGRNLQREVPPKIDELLRETDRAVREAQEKHGNPDELKRKAQKAGKDIETAILGGIEKLTKVDAADLERNFGKSLDRLDPNGDGFVTRDELDKADDNLIFKIRNAHMLKVLNTHYDTLQTLSNDEWFLENSGITVKDIAGARELTRSGLGVGVLASSSLKTAFSGETLTAAGLLTAGGLAGTLGSKVIFGAASRVPAFVGLGLAAGAIGLSGAYGALEHQFSSKPKLQALLGDLK